MSDLSHPRTGVTAPVLEPLETIANRGFTRYDVFRDWVRLGLAALQNDDEEYLNILDGYDRGHDRRRGERNADLFSAAFGEIMAALDETGRDVLGDAYEAYGMRSEEFGQHFTPHNVAASMVEMQMAGEKDSDPPVTIHDPACGSGRLLILAARQHDVATFCVGVDKDPLCARMSALNFCLFNMDAVVLSGDSLTLEMRRAWETRNSGVGGTVREVDPDDIPFPAAALDRDTEDTTPEADRGGDAADRLQVEADGAGLDQSDIRRWSE